MSKPFNQLILWAAIMIVVAGALIIMFRNGGLLDRMRFQIRSDLLAENAKLESEIMDLEEQIAQLAQQNRHLKKVLVGRTFRFSILEQTSLVEDGGGRRNPQDPSEVLWRNRC